MQAIVDYSFTGSAEQQKSHEREPYVPIATMEAALSPGDARKQVVFIVEDDLPVREALTAMLEARGLTIAAYASAESFLAVDLKTVRGCLLADENLPGISGTELTRRLVEAGGQIPVILMSGRATPAMTSPERAAGGVRTVAKPLDPQGLIDALEQAGITFPMGPTLT